MANSTKISEYSTTAANNTSIDSIDIDENCAASGINNAIRSVLKHQADAFTQGTPIALDQTNNNVGIGTTTIEDFGGGHSTLEVAGTTTSEGGVFKTATSDSAGTGTTGTEMIMFTDSTNGGSINVVSSDALRLMTANTARMTIDSSGNVGIGTTSPGGELEVYRAGTSEVLIGSDNGGTAQLSLYENDDGTKEGLLKYDGTNNRIHLATSGNADALVIPRDGGDVGIGRNDPQNIVGSHGGGLVVKSASGRASSTSHVVFQDSSGNNQFELQHGGLIIHRAGSTETMRMNTNGELLIGTTAGGSSNRLHIKGPKTVCVIANTDANGGTYQETILFRNSTDGGVGSITTNSTSVSYNTTSDHRLKENVADMTGAIDRVKALAPKRFNFIAEADTTVDGFLAHEAQAVVPEAVTGTHNEVDDDGNAVMQGIDQAKLVPLLTGALQEAIAKIETLETEMTALKARVTALEAQSG